MIEVGEYVRTKDGYIFKILTKENTNYGCCGITDSNNTKHTTYTYNKRSFNDIKNKIVKHSKNIIDLIEVGDYVNGNEVLDKYLFGGEIPVLETTGDETNVKCMCEEDIRTILTHEQFEANCYTVERKEE